MSETSVDKFVTDRLISQMKKKVKFYEKKHRHGEVKYLWLMAVNAKKKVPLERVMSSSVPLALSLFQEDSSYMCCVKSEFMHKLEEMLLKAKIIETNGADSVIFDGHATIQICCQVLHKWARWYSKTWPINSLIT